MLTVMDQFKNRVCGKSVAVIGLGISNRPLIKQLTALGAKVTARDRKPDAIHDDERSELENDGVRFILGDGYLDGLNEDIVFRTPGLKCCDPHLVEAKNNGSEITSEMQMFFELCPCPIFAVTGSDGKTTTTTLIYEMLKRQGFFCHKGGNIGAPLLPRLNLIKPTDIAVVELSSFQLQDMKNSPDVAVITNLSPNHLDYHKDMQEYVNAKANIFLHQHSNDRLVINADNEASLELVGELSDRITCFSREAAGEKSVFLKDNVITYRDMYGEKPILNTEDILLPGNHNVENYMAAIAAVMDYVDIENIRFVARNFRGVAHRIELVRDFEGVKYYNDSIASTPTRSAACLNSFTQKIILIAGGYDKKLDYSDFGILVNKFVKHLILVGATSDKIYNATVNAVNYKNIPIERFTDFNEAVVAAKNCAHSGDIVILSPASASFDMFRNFEERGNTFKDIVNNF